MPFTSNDLATLDTAIASDARRVRFSDGREVEYRSVDELKNARALVLTELSNQAGCGPLRMVHVVTDSGF